MLKHWVSAVMVFGILFTGCGQSTTTSELSGTNPTITFSGIPGDSLVELALILSHCLKFDRKEAANHGPATAANPAEGVTPEESAPTLAPNWSAGDTWGSGSGTSTQSTAALSQTYDINEVNQQGCANACMFYEQLKQEDDTAETLTKVFSDFDLDFPSLDIFCSSYLTL